MGHVFGDSTAFPYDINFIELIRHAVDAGVALIDAQHTIVNAADRRGNVDTLRKNERQRLDAMSNAMKLTMTAFMASSSERLSRTASNILETTRSIIEAEMAAVDGAATGELATAQATVEDARSRAYGAIERFCLKHDVPGTEVQLRLLAGGDSYTGQALVTTPFGLDAVFALAIPQAHEWGKLRRVAALSAGTEVRVPKESGWISKRVEMHMEKLDRYFVSEVSLSAKRARISLRKGAQSGPGWRLEVNTEEPVPKAMLLRLVDDGGEANDPPLILEGEDAVHAGRLWQRTVESTRDLAQRRQAMSSASFEGAPLKDFDQPGKIVDRLINIVAPTVQEIARRSGAPGELVLRRDTGEGRRDEIYITKAELHEKVATLPVDQRAVFDALELSEGPRSPRAPAPSQPMVIDAHADEGDVTEIDAEPDESDEVTTSR